MFTYEHYIATEIWTYILAEQVVADISMTSNLWQVMLKTSSNMKEEQLEQQEHYIT